MEITQVKVFPVEEDKLKAFVSVVFDHCFMVNDIKVIEGKDGLFLSMPSRRKRNGEFKDVAHPLNNETRRLLEENVLGEYRAVVVDETPRRPDRLEGEDETGIASEAGDPQSRSGSGVGKPEGVGEPENGEEAPLGRSVPASGRSTPVAPSAPPLAARGAGNGAASSGPTSGNGGDGRSRTTLEEVQEHHLSDSFWSVT